VLTASEGEEAIKLFRQHSSEIVCVLLDLTMPHTNSAEVLSEMRCLHPEIFVILCSGFNELDATREFIGMGLATFIQKPYTTTVLREKLKAILLAKENEEALNGNSLIEQVITE